MSFHKEFSIFSKKVFQSAKVALTYVIIFENAGVLMDILSRLFGKKVIDRPTRVKIQNFHKIEVWIDEQAYEVFNISIAGIGFMASSETPLYKKNTSVKAIVKILDKVCDIELKIRHQTKELIGCLVTGSCDVYEKFVKEYFQSELEALKLSKINEDKLNEDENGEPHWFYGDYNHEIYFTTKSDKVTSCHINYHGHMFISDNGKISTGVIMEDHNDTGKIGHRASDLIQDTNKLPKDIMEYMYRFVESAKEIEDSHQKELLTILKDKFGEDWKK